MAVTQKEVSALSYFGDILLETCVSEIPFCLVNKMLKEYAS